MTLLKLWGELMVCLPCWRVGLASFWALLAFSVALLEPASQGVCRSQLAVQARLQARHRVQAGPGRRCL